MTSRLVIATALFALGAASAAALVLLDSRPPDHPPATVPGDDRPSTATEPTPVAAPVPDAGAIIAPTDRLPIADPIARLKKLYRINPRRSDVNGKFIGEDACDDPNPPACIAATEGIDGEGMSSLKYLAWKVAIRFDPAHVGQPLRIRWKGWTSRDLVAVDLLEICRNHDEPNVRELGTYDPGLSDDDIVFAGAPGEIEVVVGGAAYRYRLERR